MKKRRLLSLILTICMVLSLTPTVAYADIQISSKVFGVGFDPCGVDEETEGKVQVQIGDGEPWFAGAWDEYGYDNSEIPITFTLTPPAEGVGYTPVVIVMDGTLHTVQPVLQKNEGKYSFTIAPNAISGNYDLPFVVYVSWCEEFDQFWPDDGQFMVETHVPGGDANGTILIQPGPEDHKSFGSKDKYIYNRHDDEDSLYVTFIPKPGMKLVAFRIGDEMYGYEAMDGSSEEDMHPLPQLRADGQCTMTIPVPALSEDADDYIYVEATFEGAYPVAPPAGLTWDGKIAKWDAVEGADHYRVTLERGFVDSNGEISWFGMVNNGIITDQRAFDFSNSIASGDTSTKYRFLVCAIKDKVCSDEVKSDPYAYVSIADETPVTNIAATITAPELGATPDYHPVYASTPENGVEMCCITWFKIAVADFTGTDEDDWDEMESDEQFEEGYYYCFDLHFVTNDGHIISESATGTVNGKPHDSTYGDVFDGLYDAYLCGFFEPLHAHVADTEWKSDADNHWKECNVVGCSVMIEGSKAAHSYGDDNVCDICGYTKTVTPPSYSIIDGANGVWTQNSDKTLAFRANGDFSKFTGIKVDDTLIDAKNYTAVSGPTVITLKADYLQTLSVGTHKLTVVYTDGECSTNFEVKAASEPTKPTDTSKPADSQAPQAGDNSNLAFWFAILFVSGIGMLGTTVYKKRKNSISD